MERKQKEFKVIIGTNDPRIKEEHFYELAAKMEQCGNSLPIGTKEQPYGLKVHISEIDNETSVSDIHIKNIKRCR